MKTKDILAVLALMPAMASAQTVADRKSVV